MPPGRNSLICRIAVKVGDRKRGSQKGTLYLTVEYNAPISFLPYKVECPPFLLQLDPVIADIADEIMSRAILPEKARTDALHIATVAHH